jgi:hypothetical protein
MDLNGLHVSLAYKQISYLDLSSHGADYEEYGLPANNAV